MYQKIELRLAPEVKAVVKAAFPDYRKHRAVLSVFDRGVNINSYWDGGSKSEYAVVELASLRRRDLPSSSHPYFDVTAHGLANVENQDIKIDHVGNITLQRLPEGFALVSAGTFCGKSATARVYVARENLAKLLPEVK